MFKKIEVTRIRLADQVYDQILHAIENGLIAPADRIVQEKLADELMVSRTPVREALLRLQQEGILTAVDRGGFTIRQVTPREIIELYQAREAIEGYCCAKLADAADPADLSRIEALIHTNENALLETVSQFYAANRQIHRAFVQATGNHHLLEMFDALWNRSLSFQTFRLMKQPQLDLTLSGHFVLVEAIRSNDPHLAAQTMSSHIRDGMQLHLGALT